MEKTMKIFRKKSAQNTSYIYKKFFLVWYNLKHSGMNSGIHNQDTTTVWAT
jgi:hypothetical protein